MYFKRKELNSVCNVHEKKTETNKQTKKKEEKNKEKTH